MTFRSTPAWPRPAQLRAPVRGWLCAALLAIAGDASAQSAASSVVSRTAPDQVTVQAARIDQALKLDGRLDEAVYSAVPAISDFLQQEPREGQPATEKTEAWIFFDDENLYVCARNWNSQPERQVANELRRDNPNILGNDNFTFVIDTLYDKRNGTCFRPIRSARCVT